MIHDYFNSFSECGRNPTEVTCKGNYEWEAHHCHMNCTTIGLKPDYKVIGAPWCKSLSLYLDCDQCDEGERRELKTSREVHEVNDIKWRWTDFNS